MDMQYLRLFGRYLLGIVTRIYWLLPSLMSDPFDIAERWFGVSYIVPQNMFWILLFIGFFIASFLTYLHDIEGKRNKQGKRTIREMLVGLLTEGESIRDSGIIEPKDEVREWANRVRFYIFENLGASHAARFMSNDGLGKVDCQMTAAFLTYRLMRIQQLLMEFKRKSVLDKEDSQT